MTNRGTGPVQATDHQLDRWSDLLGDDELSTLANARFGRRVGLGTRPAVIVIDVQRYMIGEDGHASSEYPSACGSAGVKALPRLAHLLESARSAGIPVIYTRFALSPDGSDIGVYGRKRDLLQIDGWCLEGTRGAEIHPAVQPHEGDHVIVKKKPSAFHGTPLLGLLVDRGVDSVVITGGSTSNCVRATAVDAASYNYRTLVAEDCVFDRVALSHWIALFDIDRQYGDVVGSSELQEAFSNLHAPEGTDDAP